MAHTTSHSWSGALTSTVGRLRNRGRHTLMAALGPAEEEKPKVLPALHGAALAKHHLQLAIDALHEPGMGKPEAFRKLRLQVNRLEQSGVRRIPRIEAPKTAQPTLSRREKLLGRAFDSAQMLAGWRASKKSSAQHIHS